MKSVILSIIGIIFWAHLNAFATNLSREAADTQCVETFMKMPDVNSINNILKKEKIFKGVEDAEISVMKHLDGSHLLEADNNSFLSQLIKENLKIVRADILNEYPSINDFSDIELSDIHLISKYEDTNQYYSLKFIFNIKTVTSNEVANLKLAFGSVIGYRNLIVKQGWNIPLIHTSTIVVKTDGEPYLFGSDSGAIRASSDNYTAMGSPRSGPMLCNTVKLSNPEWFTLENEYSGIRLAKRTYKYEDKETGYYINNSCNYQGRGCIRRSFNGYDYDEKTSFYNFNFYAN